MKRKDKKTSGGNRSGSVLILVVSLLVMLAMMATAYIATIRIDRVRTTGTEIAVGSDLPWIDDVAKQVLTAISDEIFDTSTTTNQTIRPPGTPAQYIPYTRVYQDTASPANKYSFYLADRYPKLAGTTPIWKFFSRLRNVQYDDIQSTASIYREDSNGVFSGGIINNANVIKLNGLTPTFVKIDYRAPTHTFATPLDLCPAVFPAFKFADATSGATSGTAFIAGDADGDGIADSLLFRVPGASGRGGSQIWAAVRVIDNNAAINASVAWSNLTGWSFTDTDTIDPSGQAKVAGKTGSLGMFPSNVDLLGKIKGFTNTGVTPPEWAEFRNYRRGGAVAGTGLNIAYSDANGAQRADMQFQSQDEAMFMQLARRLNNPGRFTSGTGTSTRYRSLAADAKYMGYRFVMDDPDANSKLLYQVAPAKIEQLLHSSVYYNSINWVRNTANIWKQYPANLPTYWFDYNFASPTTYVAPATGVDEYGPNQAGSLGASGASLFRPLRPYLVMSNPMSNTISAHAIPAAMAANLGAYPAGQNPTKASINTAPFQELMRAFWNVMCEDANPSVPATTSGQFNAVGGYAANSPEVLQLRAAVAAANAMDLRDGDSAVSSHTLPGGLGVNQVIVFGSERQPFIVDATCSAGNTSVTLFNPYTTPVSLTGMGLYSHDGSASAPTLLASGGLAGNIAPGATITVSSTTSVLGKKLFLMMQVGPEFAPLDSVDCTPFAAGTVSTTRAHDWTCVWPSTVAASGSGPVGGVAHPIQYANYAGGPNQPTAATGNKFPLGAFARDGDIMHVTYFGGMKIGNNYISVTEDAANVNVSTNVNEPVGRMCPGAITGNATVDGKYDWCAKYLDYFTTIHNQDNDYLPNVLPAEYKTATGAAITPLPEAVKNGGSGTANNHAEDTNSVSEGRININTAPFEVLRALPLGPTQADTDTIATAIITYRESASGPFKNLFDLNKVPLFQTANGTIAALATFAPTRDDGDITSDATGNDGAPAGDFEAFNHQLIRLSNLLSVRSDSFTVYILVQELKLNFDSADNLYYPVLVSQRRQAFTVNRSNVTSANKIPLTVNIPND